MKQNEGTALRLRASRVTLGTAMAFALLSLLVPTSAFAVCSAVKVTAVYSNPARCNGHKAFKSEASSRWICTSSDGQGEIVLAAFLSGNGIDFEMNGDSGCIPGTSFNQTTVFIAVKPQ
jgi:hypothetical protein